MKLCGAAYGDFVVWRENELIMHRIYPDETFISAVLEKLLSFSNWECYQNFLENGTPNHICIQLMIQWRHSPDHMTTSIFIQLAKSNGVFVELRKLGK